MGQQQTVTGSALRRILLVLTVALVMATMVLATTAPAFAKSERQEGFFRCLALAELLGLPSGEAHSECAPQASRS